MRSTALLAVLLVTGCAEQASAPAPEPAPPPAETSGPGEGMVNTANPHATAAGVAMLERGGSAVDAAIAAHAVLGLVEPQSSGLGGGGFMLVHDAETGLREVVDGRETAPAGAFPEMFMTDDGTALSHSERVQSGHAVGVPGAVALYWTAHQRHGVLPWAELFRPAIGLAEDGFEVSQRMHDSLVRIAGYTDIEDNPDTGAYFYPGGEALPVGHLLRNPEYAATLRGVVERGPEAFYEGPVAEAIVARAQQEPRGSTMTLEDIGGYEAKVRPAVCGRYRDYEVCSAPPPSSGVAVIEILGLLERLMPGGVSNDAEGWGQYVRAQLLAYADRDHYVGDGDFVDVPVADLLAPEYLDVRATELFDAGLPPTAGDPGAVLRGEPMIDRWGRDNTEEIAGTSHLSVIDADGNAVSFTASVEFVFGSQRMAAGFVLNNELTDFASIPTLGGRAVANAVEPGKRPRSSMTPTLIFDADGELLMATGSPGGNSIIAYTTKSIVGVMEFGLSVEDAVALPNVVARGHPVRVESERAPEGFIEALRDLGFPIAESSGENSGLHPILVREDGLEGAPDPRREGVATRVPARPPSDS
ncbi:MAG: gamma-glutamyltransferase [Pseudomonadales bacterium]|jgi:gamma-glutamyltranspeptidase/glutathione hydrolase|nr:gamma-glutamyltransferase [Pseudomonadales bacterium]